MYFLYDPANELLRIFSTKNVYTNMERYRLKDILGNTVMNIQQLEKFEYLHEIKNRRANFF